MRASPALVALALLGLLAGPVRASDVRFHGLLDLVATGRGAEQSANTLARGDSPFDPFGVRLSADAQVEPKLTVIGQLVLRDATTPYLDGAYLEYAPSARHDLQVLAGELP